MLSHVREALPLVTVGAVGESLANDLGRSRIRRREVFREENVIELVILTASRPLMRPSLVVRQRVHDVFEPRMVE